MFTEKTVYVCGTCGAYHGKKVPLLICPDCGEEGCESCFVKKDEVYRCKTCLYGYMELRKKEKQETCPHQSTSPTHPYGWIVCNDCGKLL